MTSLTHFDESGQAHMVDVAAKAPTKRVAVAGGRIRMHADTLRMIQAGSHRKGDVLGIARTAAIMATKRTADLIPLCHPLPITRVAVDFTPDEAAAAVECRVRVETVARTGVEMEALTGVQVALLTIYDMCKAIDRGMTMSDIGVWEKSGGQSGEWRRESGSK